jgi:hypothetical protein
VKFDNVVWGLGFRCPGIWRSGDIYVEHPVSSSGFRDIAPGTWDSVFCTLWHLTDIFASFALWVVRYVTHRICCTPGFRYFVSWLLGSIIGKCQALFIHVFNLIYKQIDLHTLKDICVQSHILSPKFQDPWTPRPRTRTSETRNLGLDIWDETFFKNVWINLLYIHKHLTNPQTPKLWTAGTRVSGFGGPGTQDSICETGKRYLQTCVNQCVCKSNFIDLPTFPKSREPNPETRQSTISGFGGWSNVYGCTKGWFTHFWKMSHLKCQVPSSRFWMSGSRNSGLDMWDWTQISFKVCKSICL